VRVLPETCAGKREIFIGAPGASDARWLLTEHQREGWLIVGDAAVATDDWPSEPPALPCGP
jgi:hypothetical protein